MFRQVSIGVLLKSFMGALAGLCLMLIAARVWTAWSVYDEAVASGALAQAIEHAESARQSAIR